MTNGPVARKRGEPIYDNYGYNCSCDLLMFWGFAPEGESASCHSMSLTNDGQVQTFVVQDGALRMPPGLWQVMQRASIFMRRQDPCSVAFFEKNDGPFSLLAELDAMRLFRSSLLEELDKADKALQQLSVAPLLPEGGPTSFGPLPWPLGMGYSNLTGLASKNSRHSVRCCFGFLFCRLLLSWGVELNAPVVTSLSISNHAEYQSVLVRVKQPLFPSENDLGHTWGIFFLFNEQARARSCQMRLWQALNLAGSNQGTGGPVDATSSIRAATSLASFA
eukprot:5156618-Amphidinium_carterae.1